MATEQRGGVYTHESPCMTYSMNWSVRALSSFSFGSYYYLRFLNCRCDSTRGSASRLAALLRTI